MEGVFIGNRFDVEHTHDTSFNDKFTGVKHKEFSEAEIEEQRMDKMMRN